MLDTGCLILDKNKRTISKADGVVKSQNLTQSRKARKGDLLKLINLFLAFLAPLRENTVFTNSSKLTVSLKSQNLTQSRPG